MGKQLIGYLSLFFWIENLKEVLWNRFKMNSKCICFILKLEICLSI